MAYKYVAHIHQNKIQDHTLFISILAQHHPLRKKNIPQSDGVFFLYQPTVKLDTEVFRRRDRTRWSVALYPGEPIFMKYDKYVIQESSSNWELARCSGFRIRGIPKCFRANLIPFWQLLSLQKVQIKNQTMISLYLRITFVLCSFLSNV